MEKKFDDLLIEKNLKERIKEEMQAAKNHAKEEKKELKFEDLSEKELFSTRALWKVFNRKNYTNSLINGFQAEAFLGNNDNLRSEILNHSADCFLSNHLYIEFYRYE